MGIRVYLSNSVAAAPVSQSDLTNPISFLINPDVDADDEKTLYLANERATLAATINDSTTTVTVQESGRFANGEFIIVDDEVMKITSGGGTTTLTVERGLAGTSATSHNSGAVVYSGYDYHDITLEFIDQDGTDETSWTRLAWANENLADKQDGNSITAEQKAYDTVLEFKMRMTVPSGQSAHLKTDLALRVTGVEAQAIPA